MRWSRSAIHAIDNVPEGTTPSIPTEQEFDFNDDMCNPNKNSTERRTQSMHQHPGQEETPEELSREGSDVSAATCTVFGVDGLAPKVSKRKYCKTKRGAQHRGDRKIGTSRAQKVSLARVQNDMQSSLCSKGCLKKLSAGAVLMKRYKAWGSNTYEERASWILENLMEYYSEETDKFETKVCGQSVCNDCYAVALGYSKHCIEELKSDIRSTGIVSQVFDIQCSGRSVATHGNTVHVPRTTIGMQAMESVFEKYVQKSGYTQPHRQCRRRKDKTIVPLVLLLVNTKREDVFHVVLADVQKITMGKALGPCLFYRMWRMHYTHVQIPPHFRFSKCQVCWEYQTCFEASNTNPTHRNNWYENN